MSSSWTLHGPGRTCPHRSRSSTCRRRRIGDSGDTRPLSHSERVPARERSAQLLQRAATARTARLGFDPSFRRGRRHVLRRAAARSRDVVRPHGAQLDLLVSPPDCWKQREREHRGEKPHEQQGCRRRRWSPAADGSDPGETHDRAGRRQRDSQGDHESPRPAERGEHANQCAGSTHDASRDATCHSGQAIERAAGDGQIHLCLIAEGQPAQYTVPRPSMTTFTTRRAGCGAPVASNGRAKARHPAVPRSFIIGPSSPSVRVKYWPPPGK